MKPNGNARCLISQRSRLSTTLTLLVWYRLQTNRLTLIRSAPVAVFCFLTHSYFPHCEALCTLLWKIYHFHVMGLTFAIDQNIRKYIVLELANIWCTSGYSCSISSWKYWFVPLRVFPTIRIRGQTNWKTHSFTK